jgi:Putative metallopeptidase
MAAAGRNSKERKMSRKHPLAAPCALLSLALAAPLFAPSATAQNWQSSLPANINVDVHYIPPSAPELEKVYQTLKERQVLEELAHFLAPLRLPHPLRLVTRQCDTVNAWYQPGDRSLNFCYELVAWLQLNAPQTVSGDGFVTRAAAIFGGFVGVVLHESGHMMFDMLDVPVFGREEDAADEISSFIALQFNKDVERAIIKGFAYFNAKATRDPTAASPIRAWSDEHGTASQRLYNTLCIAYGADPQTFGEFLDRGWLPTKRAEHCGDEYNQLKFGFVTTILPFIDRSLMERVQQTQWLTPEELK